MLEDIVEEIFRAIKKDDVQSFEKCYQQGRTKELAFGRFPLLSLCYLYKARKIISKYEDELLRVKNYIQVEEKPEMYALFKSKAGRTLRIYVANNQMVHPLEMLAILNKATRLENVYKKALKTNQTIENLQTIEMIKSSTKIEASETKIKLPKQKISNELLKIAAIIVCVAFIFALAFSGLAVFIHFEGSGSEDNPYSVTSMKQLNAAMEAGAYIVLNADIEGESISFDDYDKKINGNGHTITLTNQTSAIFKELSGNIENVNFVITANYSNNADSAILCTKNSGTITNVNITLDGEIKYTGSAAGENDVKVAIYTTENKGTIENCKLTTTANIIGNGTSSIAFGGFASTNSGTIKSCEINGAINLDEIDGASTAYTNTGIIDSIINNASVKQTSNAFNVVVGIAGICLINDGTVSNAINNGRVEIVATNTKGVYINIGGIVCVNHAEINRCKNNGEVAGDCQLSQFAIGGITAYSEPNTSEARIENCASIGKITMATVDTRTNGYMGGISGEVSNLHLINSFSIADIDVTGTFSSIYAAGLVGAWYPSYELQNNAYLATEKVPHGIYLYETQYIWSQLVPYDRGDGMFEKYETISEIEQLEIYW